MVLENCQISYNNPTGIYFPGQTLSGKVEFNFNSTKKVRGISILFNGEAHVHWTELESQNSPHEESSTQVSYNGNEEYFSCKYYVLGGSNHDSIELPVGQHVFPFTTAIPNFLPSSFEGDRGYIRYTVKATLERPWKFDQHIKAAFTIISHLDCNTNPQYREPATLTMEKFLCCCCCREGPITGILKLPCTGFVSGQIIPYIIELDNASKTDVSDIKMKLKKLVFYHSQTPSSKTKTSTDTVAEFLVGNTVPAQDSQTFSNNFTLPALPPSNLQNCRIIDLVYALQITVSIAGCHKDMTGHIPVIIGTIPLTNMVPLTTLAPSPNFEADWECTNARQPLLGRMLGPSRTSAPAQANATAPIDPYLLSPPRYGACQFGTTSILDTSDSEFTKLNNDKCHAPIAPVYNFIAPPAAESSQATPYPIPAEGTQAPPYTISQEMPVVPPTQGTSMMPVPVHGAQNSMPCAPSPQKM